MEIVEIADSFITKMLQDPDYNSVTLEDVEEHLKEMDIDIREAPQVKKL